jgi:hypothetical protein
MKQVFVSYSRTDLTVVTKMIEDLEAAGIDVWHDRTLTAGQRWWDNILVKIRECDIFVLALSPDSLDSEACGSELGYVVQLGRTILPVVVASGINLNLLHPPLNEIQVTDYRRRGAAFALIKSINSAAPAMPLPDPLPTPPPVPGSYLGGLAEQIHSSNPLEAGDQIALFQVLEERLREGRYPTEIRELLLGLRQREDLLVKVEKRIDRVLQRFEDRTAPYSRDHAGFTSTARTDSRRSEESADNRRPRESQTCPKCAKPVDAKTRFCGACGASLPEDSAPKKAQPISKSREYACSAADSEQLIVELKSWLEGEGFDSQQLPAESDSVVLQVKRQGRWRDFVGMATSLNVVFQPSADALIVEIGAGKWMDKAAVGVAAVGAGVIFFPFLPLAVTAGFGVWEQATMPNKIFAYIDALLLDK